MEDYERVRVNSVRVRGLVKGCMVWWVVSKRMCCWVVNRGNGWF